MKITSIHTTGVGPLPELEWKPGNCEVIYDDNQQGKTTLIDLLIETVFREGRKKLFSDARRYEDYGDARVTVETGGEHVVFGQEGDDRNFSDLLGWNLPELHRLLCIRASQVGLAGPVGGDDLWESLASVIEGMTDNYLESVRDDVLDRGNLTPSLRWQNQQPDYFKDRLLEEIIPGIERAREGESVLRKTLELQSELEELEAREETLREETLEELENNLEERKRQRSMLEVRQARDRLKTARTIKNEIDEDFGRIRDEFEDPWREAKDDLADARQRLDDLKESLSDFQGEREDLRADRDELEDELEEYDEEIETKNQTLNQLEDRRDEDLGELRRERSELDQVTRRAEDCRDQFEAWRSRWQIARWVLISGVILLSGSFLITPFRFLYGLALGLIGLAGTAGGSVVYWLKQARLNEFDTLREELEDRLADWPVEVNEKPLRVARDLLNRDVKSLLSERNEEIETLREELQSLREDRSGRKGTLESTENRLEAVGEKIRELRDEVENQEETIESLEETCEEFRQKTGLPDFDTYREKLQERRDREGKLESIKSQLIGQLDVGSEATLADLRSHVDRLDERLGEVGIPEETPEELEDAIGELEDEIERTETEIQQLQNKIRSRRNQLNETVKPLHDLGVDPEEPEKLFEKETEWEQSLTDAVRDRLAAAFCVKLLEGQKGDYMDSIRDLLNRGNEDGRTLSDLYGSVMDEGSRVELDPDSGEFTVSVDGMSLHEDGLSTGARTHLYFSCRLMLLQELFVEEPGFMILDDPFLSYFPERKRRAIELLEPFLEEGWQLLFFTVDPTARDTFENRLGAVVRTVEDLQS